MKIPQPRKLPSGNWFVQVNIDKRPVYITEPTKEEAARKAAELKFNQQARKRIAARKDLKTVGQLLDDYIAASPLLSPSTLRGYGICRRNGFKTIMDKPYAEVDNWQEAVNVEARRVKEKTVVNEWGAIHAAIGYAGLPLPEVTLPAVPVKDMSVIYPDEIPAFLKMIRGDKYEIPALLALHSLRRSEIFALTWDKIDLKHGIIHVSGARVPDENHKFVDKKQNKNETSSRPVAIWCPRLAALLEAEPDKKGKVVKCAPGSPTRRIEKLCASFGLPENAGLHALRRSFASICYDQGISERDCMEIGGWSNVQTMHKLYIKIGAHQKDESVKKLKAFGSSLQDE